MSEETISESDPGVQAVEAALRTLGEHFDSCHIVCTRKESDGKSGFTDIISRGNGNFYARYGSLRDSVIKLEEEIRFEMRSALESND